MIKQAMVLAAGRGKRLGPITEKTPKPLVSVADKTPLFRCLSMLQESGIERAVVNAHHLYEQIENAVAFWLNVHGRGMDVVISHEKEALLETGGGLRYALPLLDENAPCFVVNSDIIWPVHFCELIKKMSIIYQRQEMDALLALTPTAQTENFREIDHGDFFIENSGKISFFNPQMDNDAPYVFCGVSVINPHVLLKEETGTAFSLVKPWREMETAGRLFGMPHTYEWADMGTPKGFAYATTLLKNECESAQLVTGSD